MLPQGRRGANASGHLHAACATIGEPSWIVDSALLLVGLAAVIVCIDRADNAQ
jgi:hypothetical protein